jgi:rhodanese-related sulfurtransferase
MLSPEKLFRLIGRHDSPTLIDVRTEADAAADSCLVPGAVRREPERVAEWAPALPPEPVVVICAEGHARSEGTAAWLRHAGLRAEILEGGHAAWRDRGLPLVPESRIPQRGPDGATLWVTRSRPKIDRIACPWLIRRFVDPDAQFLFVAPAEVGEVADRFGAIPFDVEGCFWSHRGDLCTFDVMVAEWGLATEALDRLARVVRGADTNRHDLAPEAAGLLAISVGLSRQYRDDLAQLEAGMVLYDALYRWARDGADVGHDWPGPGGAR